MPINEPKEVPMELDSTGIGARRIAARDAMPPL
jgi:hypothetical protein